MRVEPFKASHLDSFLPQPRQAEGFALLTPEFAQRMEQGVAYSAVEDNRTLACAGFVETQAGPVAWAWLSEGAPLLTLHRYVQAALREVPLVWAYADERWPEAGRWLSMLGFVETNRTEDMAGPHRLYLKNG